jgi:hypothetical protein
MPMNASNVVEGEGNSTESAACLLFTIAAVTDTVSPYPLPKAEDEDLADLTVPHLFWPCMVSSPADNLPITVNTLIDHSSHVVLINKEFTQTLFLKHCKLHNPTFHRDGYGRK